MATNRPSDETGFNARRTSPCVTPTEVDLNEQLSLIELRANYCGMAKDRICDIVGTFGSDDRDRVTLVKIAEPCRLALRELMGADFDRLFQLFNG